MTKRAARAGANESVRNDDRIACSVCGKTIKPGSRYCGARCREAARAGRVPA